MSRFLKLSTSKEARLLPGSACPVAVRSSPLVLSCGSMDANVLENGFAGIPLGDIAECGARYSLPELVIMSDVAISISCGVSCACIMPTHTSLLGRLTDDIGAREATYSVWLGRWTRAECSASSTSSVSGCGGMKVVSDSMRTCFFVFGGGAPLSSYPVTHIIA
jgi:hypothetical protein